MFQKIIKKAFLCPVFLFLLVSAGKAQEQTYAETVNRHLLSEFGPYKTVDEATKTFKKATDEIREQGGGILVIPDDAPKYFMPQNTSQEKYNSPAVTVYDYRQGIEKVYVPALGAPCSDPFRGGGCRITERHLKKNLPWAGTYFTQKYLGHYYGGASSVMRKTLQDCSEGENSKIHILSLRGIFSGQMLDITGGGNREWINVKELGNDSKGPYITADLKKSYPKNSTVFNKNVIGGISINDVSNCDNQSCSLDVDRAVYGTGDSFNITAHLKYQGNIMSDEGDEGAVVYTAEIVQDMYHFRGKVESWNPETRELVYQPGSVWPNKLGTSRPIINMNTDKWVTKGSVMIVNPGGTYLREDKPNPAHSSLIVGSADCGWDESLKGRWFAVNEPDEYYDKNDSLGPLGSADGIVRLWWHITGVEKRADGRINLFVEKTKWGTNLKAGPALYSYSNYSTSDSNKKDLKYIIAPGAWVSDVRNGISGYAPGLAGTATKGEPRTLVLAPAPSFGTPADFAKDDPIIQAIGSCVYAPTGFRVRHFNMTPPMSQMGNSSFEATNWGRSPVSTALLIHGPGGALDDVGKRLKCGKTPFGSAVVVNTATTNTFVVKGPVADSVFDLWQHDGNIKKFRWRQPGNGQASFHVDPQSSAFCFRGGPLELNSRGITGQRGISATEKEARNLRGIDVAVKAGESVLELKFTRPEPDAAYSINVQPNWNTNDWISSKRADGFTVEFSTPAVPGAKIDWQLIR